MGDLRSATNYATSTGVHYVTGTGLRQMHEELRGLLMVRPQAGVTLGTPRERAAQAGLGARIAGLDRRIARARVPSPPESFTDHVTFGANVTLRGDDEHLVRLSIVGVDEAAQHRGRIAHTSAAARALEGRRTGDSLLLRLPRMDRAADDLRSAEGRREALAGQSREPEMGPFMRYRIVSIDYVHPATI